MNWYKKSLNRNIMYHNTPKRFVPIIRQEGLKINSQYNKSQASQWFIPEIYKINPIFLSLKPEIFKEIGDITLKIDTTGLTVVADIPSLTKYGAYYDETGEGLWFKRQHLAPKKIRDMEDEDNMIYYWDLLDPNSQVVQTCIELTQTAACMENIKPNRII